jgi:hypothetical protein
MYSVIAAGIMNLTYLARLKPELPYTVYFEKDQNGLPAAARQGSKPWGRTYYLVCLPPVADVILWVKFSPNQGGGVLIRF